MLQFGKYFWEYSVVKNILFNFDVEQVRMSKIEKENLGRDRFIYNLQSRPKKYMNSGGN